MFFYSNNNDNGNRRLLLFIVIAIIAVSRICLYIGDNKTADNNDTETESSATDSVNVSINTSYFNNSNLSYPMGSAEELSGDVAVVSVFALTPDYSWDFSDSEDCRTREDTLKYMDIASEWIEKNAVEWNQDVNFIYDWKKCEYLYYEADLSENVLISRHNYGGDEVGRYIDSNIPSISQIKNKLDCDEVVYIIYYNTDDKFTDVSNTSVYYDGCNYPYEYVSLYCNNNYCEEPPAVYAHEILHAFGAPDLYTADEYGNNYGTTDELVDYIKNNLDNEIMYTTYDRVTGECHYSSITNDLTEITAYYIGWTDRSAIAEKFGMQSSSHSG